MLLRALVVSSGLLAGCASVLGLDTPGHVGGGDAGAGDDAIDGPPGSDTLDAATCYGTFEMICIDPPTMPVTYTANTTIDTTAGTGCTLTTVMGHDLCVVAATSVTVNPSIRVQAVGTHPLVLLATGDIQISGTLDVGSHRAGNLRGAGGDADECTLGIAPQATSGGYGGSFAGTGGDGGRGGNGNLGGHAAPALAARPARLRGGCPGSKGGGVNAGDAGHGGGAVLLVAGGTVTVTGTLAAGGAGASGTGGTLNGGGGGGAGSGGMIVFDAQSTMISGTVFATGGGGGEGGSLAANGMPGSDPTTPNQAAQGGGGGTSSGGDGGDGAFAANLNGGTGQNVGGSTGTGGGGGGASGFVLARGTVTSSGAIAPPPM